MRGNHLVPKISQGGRCGWKHLGSRLWFRCPNASWIVETIVVLTTGHIAVVVAVVVVVVVVVVVAVLVFLVLVYYCSCCCYCTCSCCFPGRKTRWRLKHFWVCIAFNLVMWWKMWAWWCEHVFCCLHSVQVISPWYSGFCNPCSWPTIKNLEASKNGGILPGQNHHQACNSGMLFCLFHLPTLMCLTQTFTVETC